MNHHDDNAAAGVAFFVPRNGGACRRSSSLQQQQPTCRRDDEPKSSKKLLLWSVMAHVTKWTFFLYLLQTNAVAVRGQELPLYPEFSYDTNTSYRTDVCDRFHAVQRGELPFRESLKDVALVPLMRPVEQFHLREDGRIDQTNPGMLALLLDEVARRAGFTWRDSFGIFYQPGENKTWTDLLLAGTQQYDFIPDYWAVTESRLNVGISYAHGYYDAGLIVVGKKLDADAQDTLVLFNWLQPFESRVWFAMLLTILYSALVYSFLEWCGDEQDNRTCKEWFADSFYFSSLLFTQNFEFAPKSVATRLFAISMALWALLMTTTYTANLANFFVTKATIQREVSTIEMAVERGYKFCSWGGTYVESWAKQRYPTIQLVPKIAPTSKDVFLGLINDECHFALTTQNTWERFEVDKDVNQNCTLEQVGEKYVENAGSFALYGDHAVYCTSLIGDVLNLHLQELDFEGFLDELWADHLDKISNNVCNAAAAAVEDDAAAERRQLLLEGDPLPLLKENAIQDRQRRLKAKQNAAAAAGAGRFDLSGSHSLNVKNLAGSFVLHAVLSVIALMISCWQNLQLERRQQQQQPENGKAPNQEQETNQVPTPDAKNELSEVVRPLVPWQIRFDPNRTTTNASTTQAIQMAYNKNMAKTVYVKEALYLLDNMHKELKVKVLAVSAVIQSLDPKHKQEDKATGEQNRQEDESSLCSFADEENDGDDDPFDPKPPPPVSSQNTTNALFSAHGGGRRRVSFSDQNPDTRGQIEEDQEDEVSC